MLRLKAFSSIGNKMLILLSGLSKNEKKEYDISDSFAKVRYSHSLIQQTLLYMALADSNGIIHMVLEKELASEMDCSVRTIKHNNKILMDAGVITWGRLFPGCIEVKFQGYLQNVLDLKLKNDSSTADVAEDIQIVSGDEVGLSGKFETKKGYAVLSADRVRELVKLKDVNALRIALRFYRAFEKDVVVRNQPHTFSTYTEFKQFLPKYLHFPKAINDLLGKVKGLFDMSIYHTAEELSGLVEGKAPNDPISQMVKTGFLTRYTVSKMRNSRIEKSTQIIKLRAAYHDLRIYASKESDYYSNVVKLSDGELKALISSFGLHLIGEALDVVRTLYSGTPISLDESDKPPLMQRFEFNPSLCLREIANNF